MCKYVQVLFLFYCLNAVGQSTVQRPNPFISIHTISNNASFIPDTTASEVTAIAIKSANPDTFHVVVGADTVEVPLDEDSGLFTYFLSLSTPSKKIRVITESGSYQLFLIHSGSIPEGFSTARKEAMYDCGEPLSFVPQTEWRAGLPDPDYSRSFHDVNHQIVHHSAGSNANDNYTQVVRDIYVFHTEVNGWSDIGYNYLISQDGTLYAGRDPNGGDQDDVRGAHFCGKNTGTLGVCLLGNFETATPSDEAWITLRNFLTFEMINMDLEPFGEAQHSTGVLGTIAGHRDGCATLCPGENVYVRIDQLRSEVSAQLDNCIGAPVLAIQFDSVVAVGEPVVFDNLSTGFEEYSWVLQGGFPSLAYGEGNVLVTYSEPGIFDVILLGHRGSQTDSLILLSSVKATRFPKTPLLFPNPISGDEILKIDYAFDIETATVYDAMGKPVETSTTHFDLNVKPGIYYLKITSQSQTFTKKLIVR